MIRDPIIEAAASALQKVIAGSNASPPTRRRAARGAYDAVIREGQWDAVRRWRLLRALSEAADLEGLPIA